MENLKEDMPCNCGTFLNNFLIKYEKVQIVLKTLLHAMMKKIEQLTEESRVHGSMGPHLPIGRPQVGRYRCMSCIVPTSQFRVAQMGTLHKILESNGAYGPPPKQLVHNPGRF
jgi:hypothetical protein